MRIMSIDSTLKTQPYRFNSTISMPSLKKTLGADTVSFRGVRYGDPLKKLVEYGVYDMYTGLRLLDSKYIENLLRSNYFNKPIFEITSTLQRAKDALNDNEKAILSELIKIGKKKPNIKLDKALKMLHPKHEKNLLQIQQPIFEELVEKACYLPEQVYSEFIDLMNVTNKRLLKDPVVMPFSSKEFIYKLKRAKDEIVTKNNSREIMAINNLIKTATQIFEEQNKSASDIPIKKLSREEKLKKQMQKDVLKENSMNMKLLRYIFDNSVLHKNEELKQIFNTASAKIHGFPAITPFKRKEFVHDLESVLSKLKDQKLKSEMLKIAHKLPTSTENVSAFIVKYADDSPSKIGFSLLKNAMCSVDHIKATKSKGKDKLANYGLCSVYTNRLKTNIPFDKWCRMHPETRKNCQKYIDRMIELYNDGTFKKVGLERNYIIDFSDTIKELSPKENPIILDLSKLNP